MTSKVLSVNGLSKKYGSLNVSKFYEVPLGREDEYPYLISHMRLGSHFVASYDSHGYGRSILTTFTRGKSIISSGFKPANFRLVARLNTLRSRHNSRCLVSHRELTQI
jgi:hypothetical protein